jgi:hypothetical protein
VVALDHHALHGVGAAEGGGRRGHVAGGELGADPGRGHDVAVVGLQGDGDHLDPPGAAEVGQQGGVAGGLVAEAEVLAHHHRPGGQGVEQDLGGERLGRDLRQLAGELEHQHDVHAGRAEQVDPAVEGGEQRRLAARAEHGQRVAVEGDRGRRHAPGRRLGRHPAQQGPVPPVDAVEHPHGDHRRLHALGQGRHPVVALHRGTPLGFPGPLPIHRGTPLGFPGPLPIHRGTPLGFPGPLRRFTVMPAPPWGGPGRRCPG